MIPRVRMARKRLAIARERINAIDRRYPDAWDHLSKKIRLELAEYDLWLRKDPIA